MTRAPIAMPSIGDLCASMLQPVIKAKAMPKEPNKNEVDMIETPMIETPRTALKPKAKCINQNEGDNEDDVPEEDWQVEPEAAQAKDAADEMSEMEGPCGSRGPDDLQDDGDGPAITDAAIEYEEEEEEEEAEQGLVRCR